MFRQIDIRSSERVELLDITTQVREFLRETSISEGIMTIYTPHTTAAITINENTDPDVKKDIVKEINKTIPFADNYYHFEGNSAAHIKSSIFGVSETVIVKEGEMLLGRWQGIFFCEFDGPRARKIYLKFSEG